MATTSSPAAAAAAAAPSESSPGCVKKREPGKVTRVIKIGVMGDGTVGKTTLLLSYITHGFMTEYVPTVFDNFSAIEELDGEVVNVILWDLAGQDEYASVRTTCYQNCQYDVLLLCFSVIHRDSFENVKFKWCTELKRFTTTPVLLVGCKTDLRVDTDVAHVSVKEGERRCKEIKARRYLECTAKQPESVGKVVKEAISILIEADKEVKRKTEKQFKKEKKEEEKLVAQAAKLEKKQAAAAAAAAASSPSNH